MTYKLWKTNVTTPLDADPIVGISKDPLDHVSDREMCMMAILSGGRVGICPNPATIYDDIKILSPSFLSATPRFFNVIQSDYTREISLIDKTLPQQV